MIKHILTLVWNKRKSNFLFFMEIFFSFLILFAVFSFVIYNLRIYQSPLGFDTEDIVLAGMDFPDEIDSLTVYDTKLRLRQELEAHPQIEKISYTNGVTPFAGNTWSTSSDDNGFELRTLMYFPDAAYAETAGLNITEGRWFHPDDENAKYEVIVLTHKLREQYFGEKPIIDSIILMDGDEHKVVGVVDHFKYKGEFAEEEALTFFHRPFHERSSRVMHLRLKPNAPATIEEDINTIISSIVKNNDFVTWSLDNRRQARSRSVWVPMIALLSICGFLIFNVALGLFGVLWFNIGKRRPEIGLRRAMGATRGEVSRQFVLEVLMVVFLGILLGLFFAMQLPILKVVDIPASNYYLGMLAAAGLIFLLVLICAYYPSRQAAKVQPAVALHEN